MKLTPKQELKMLKNYANFVSNEEAQLRKINYYYKISNFIAWLLIIFTFLASTRNGTLAMQFAAFGFAAGLLLGYAMYFYNSLLAWPITKRFLNIEAIKAEYKNVQNP